METKSRAAPSGHPGYFINKNHCTPPGGRGSFIVVPQYCHTQRSDAGWHQIGRHLPVPSPMAAYSLPAHFPHLPRARGVILRSTMPISFPKSRGSRVIFARFPPCEG